VPDPVAGQIGVILMMKASAAAFPPDRLAETRHRPSKCAGRHQLALRLKVVDRKITERTRDRRISRRVS